MSTQIKVNCPCWYKDPHEIGNDWFDNEFPFCPGCWDELTLNPQTNDYR